MPRSGSRRQPGPGRVVGGQLSFGGIQPIDQDFVQAEIGRKGKTAGGVQVHRVGVRSLLAPRIDARSFVLNRRRRFAEPPVPANRQASDTAAAVVRNQHVLACWIDDQVARAGALRRLLVQQGKLAGCRIHGKRAYRTCPLALEIAHLAYRVQQRPARMNRQERRVGHLGGQLGRSQLAGGKIQVRKIDAFALATCVRADVNPKLSGAGSCGAPVGGLRGCRTAAKKKTGKKPRQNRTVPDNHRASSRVSFSRIGSQGKRTKACRIAPSSTAPTSLRATVQAASSRSPASRRRRSCSPVDLSGGRTIRSVPPGSSWC